MASSASPCCSAPASSPSACRSPTDDRDRRRRRRPPRRLAVVAHRERSRAFPLIRCRCPTIWASWRLESWRRLQGPGVGMASSARALDAGDDDANLIVPAASAAFMILDECPYTNGRLMVAPYEGVGRAAGRSTMRRCRRSCRSRSAGSGALERSYAPHGYSRLRPRSGRGRGVEHHVHMHVVARSSGDTDSCRCSARPGK